MKSTASGWICSFQLRRVVTGSLDEYGEMDSLHCADSHEENVLHTFHEEERIGQPAWVQDESTSCHTTYDVNFLESTASVRDEANEFPMIACHDSCSSSCDERDGTLIRIWTLVDSARGDNHA